MGTNCNCNPVPCMPVQQNKSTDEENANETNQHKQQQQQYDNHRKKESATNQRMQQKQQQRVQKYTPSDEELLVYGYIRRIQNVLNKKMIIPHEVFKICWKFYGYCRKCFFHRKCITYEKNKQYEIEIYPIISYANTNHNNTNKRVKRKRFIPKFTETGFTISFGYFNYDLDMIKYIKLSNKYLQTVDYMSSLSYIPLIKHNNISYNAIFGVADKFDPFLCLFQPEESDTKSNDNSEIVTSYEYISDINIQHRVYAPMLFCGYQNGIVYSSMSCLFQLKLEQFNKNDDILNHFKFTRIKPFNDDNGSSYWDSWNDFQNADPSFKMIYMSNKNQIFAMNKPYRNKIVIIKCGIYDFKLNKWIKCKNISCNESDYCAFAQSELFYDPRNNLIFITVKSNIASIFDVNQNEWKSCHDSNNYYNRKKNELSSMHQKFHKIIEDRDPLSNKETTKCKYDIFQ